MPEVRIIGPGRAGLALAAALRSVGWPVREILGRTDSLDDAAAGVDLLVLATPDAAIAGVARQVKPVAGCVVAHLSGSLGLDVLAPHAQVASLHPLRAIPSPDTALAGAWFAVTGHPLIGQLVDAIGGRALSVDDDDRVRYHAAATIASNHLTALLGQVERIAATAGVPLEAYLDLIRGTVDNVARVGASAALTGPVSRGDWSTVVAHVEALPAEERATYRALAVEAARLAGRDLPAAVLAMPARAARIESTPTERAAI